MEFTQFHKTHDKQRTLWIPAALFLTHSMSNRLTLGSCGVEERNKKHLFRNKFPVSWSRRNKHLASKNNFPIAIDSLYIYSTLYTRHNLTHSATPCLLLLGGLGNSRIRMNSQRPNYRNDWHNRHNKDFIVTWGNTHPVLLLLHHLCVNPYAFQLSFISSISGKFLRHSPLRRRRRWPWMTIIRGRIGNGIYRWRGKRSGCGFGSSSSSNGIVKVISYPGWDVLSSFGAGPVN